MAKAATGQPMTGKIGQGHAQGMLRMGFKEGGQIVHAFPDSIRVGEEPGVFGNALPQQVMQQVTSQEPELEMEM